MISDESEELSLVLHTRLLERKPSPSLLSWSRSEEGRGSQQMSPELLNEVFLKKSTQCIRGIGIESLMIPDFQRINEVCSS